MATSPAAASQAAPHAVILEAPAVEERVSPLAVGSWALYDFANTIFSMNIVSVFFPGFILQLGLRDAAYAFPMSAALLVVALLMPLLGAMSDRAGRRMPWLIGFTLLCIGMTVVMGLTDQVWLLIGAYVIASIGYQTALVFYDALLPSVSNTVNWGKVSGLGVGLGYAGAVGGLWVVTRLVGGGSQQNAFIPSALLFMVFALPCFLFVRERRRPQAPERIAIAWRQGVSQTWRTIQEARAVPGLLRFLVANFFYSDALNTVIIAMGVYATTVIGFGTALEVLGPATVAAVIGSWLFGLVTDRLTSKQSLIISLLMWVGVFLAAMFVTDRVLFQWVVAPVAGVALGSTWTAARTMMVELSPPERLGEFMGIYNLTGKFAAVLGPALWGGTLWLLNPDVYGRFAYQVAIGTLLVMVVIGFVLHLFTPNIKRVKHVS
ncbi:MAG TPA: MFS transporter [Chloroflexia bacterium]|nr:MFS transporter [Chloroflexia bacterium]